MDGGPGSNFPGPYLGDRLFSFVENLITYPDNAEDYESKPKQIYTCNHNISSFPLRWKTILEHHRLISTILGQAEKEMLVPYNAAAKATPPKAERKEPNYFQPEDVAAILGALEREPLKWKEITHLLIVTGCRRGEIMGLKWDKVDLDGRRITIDRALLAGRRGVAYEDTTKTGDVRYLNIPC